MSGRRGWVRNPFFSDEGDFTVLAPVLRVGLLSRELGGIAEKEIKQKNNLPTIKNPGLVCRVLAKDHTSILTWKNNCKIGSVNQKMTFPDD